MPSTGFRRRADLSGVFRISDRSVLVMSAEAAGSVEAGVKRQITAIEATILEQVQADPDLAQRFAILTSIPGLSAITAFALLIEMPELGALEPGQAASLAGLEVSQALRLWRDSRVAGPVAPSSAATEPASARPPTSPRWSRPDSIRT